MTAPAGARELLSRVQLFAGLSSRSLRRLARLCVVRSYPAGSVLIEQDGTGLGLFVLTAGSVEVARTAPGGRLVLATLGPGDVVGELALIDDQPRSASVAAVTATECLLITRNGFRELVRRDPEIAWLFVPVLAERVREMQDLVAAHGSPPGGGAAPGAGSPPEADEDGAAGAGPEADPEEEGAAETALRELLHVQHALARAALSSMESGVGMTREFLDTLRDEAALDSDGPGESVARSLPSGLVKAAVAALRKGEKGPEKALSALRHHLRRGSK